MTLILDEVTPFVEAVNNLDYIPKEGVDGGLQQFVKLEQINNNTLLLTCKGTSNTWLRQFVYSNNTQVGITYAILNKDLQDKCSSIKDLKDRGIYICRNSKGLFLHTYKEYNSSKKPKTLNQLLLHQYMGNIDDFNTEIFIDNPICILDSKDFYQLLTYIYTFSSNNLNDTNILLVFNKEKKVCEVYSRHKLDPNCICRTFYKAEVVEDKIIIIPSTIIPMLKGIVNTKSKSGNSNNVEFEDAKTSVVINEDERNVTIIGENGSVTYNKVSEDIYSSNIKWVNIFKRDIEVKDERELYLHDLLKEVEVQKPKPTSGSPRLVLENDEEEIRIVLSKEGDVEKKEKSYIYYKDVEKGDNPLFIPIRIHGEALKDILQILNSDKISSNTTVKISIYEDKLERNGRVIVRYPLLIYSEDSNYTFITLINSR